MKKKFIEQTIILKYVLWGDYLTPFTFFVYETQNVSLLVFAAFIEHSLRKMCIYGHKTGKIQWK